MSFMNVEAVDQAPNAMINHEVRKSNVCERKSSGNVKCEAALVFVDRIKDVDMLGSKLCKM